MTDCWIPATARLLVELARDGVSGTGTFSERSAAAAAARAMAARDPAGPTMPVVVPKPIHRTGPEGLRPELAVEGEIAFDYVNWRGERARRRARGPYSIRYGATEYHPEPQYLLSAVDLDRGLPREYALADMVPCA
jgi:hypothetical protein